jgi:hypothetical protein
MISIFCICTILSSFTICPVVAQIINNTDESDRDRIIEAVSSFDNTKNSINLVSWIAHTYGNDVAVTIIENIINTYDSEIVDASLHTVFVDVIKTYEPLQPDRDVIDLIDSLRLHYVMNEDIKDIFHRIRSMELPDSITVEQVELVLLPIVTRPISLLERSIAIPEPHGEALTIGLTVTIVGTISGMIAFAYECYVWHYRDYIAREIYYPKNPDYCDLHRHFLMHFDDSNALGPNYPDYKNYIRIIGISGPPENLPHTWPAYSIPPGSGDWRHAYNFRLINTQGFGAKTMWTHTDVWIQYAFYPSESYNTDGIVFDKDDTSEKSIRTNWIRLRICDKSSKALYIKIYNDEQGHVSLNIYDNQRIKDSSHPDVGYYTEMTQIAHADSDYRTAWTYDDPYGDRYHGTGKIRYAVQDFNLIEVTTSSTAHIEFGNFDPQTRRVYKYGKITDAWFMVPKNTTGNLVLDYRLASQSIATIDFNENNSNTAKFDGKKLVYSNTSF